MHPKIEPINTHLSPAKYYLPCHQAPYLISFLKRKLFKINKSKIAKEKLRKYFSISNF